MEKNLQEKIKKSPSLKNLSESLEAFRLVCTYAEFNQVIFNTCFRQLKADALFIAEKDGTNEKFIEILKKADIPDIPWHDIIYILMEKVPSVKEYMEKEYMEIA